jgi:glycosyltransferase involved in cell wall biosynthesis
MKIEAVVVCVNYSDFLTHTLPYNKSYFERMVVVTDTKDVETHKLCERWNVMCIKTDEIYRDGLVRHGVPIPNKAIAINEGLKHLAKDGWVLQMDADIWLPPFFRNFMTKLELEDDCIYGIDRLMIDSYKEWYKFTHITKGLLHEGWTFLRTDKLRVGARVVHHQDGYMPIGFFQLWNPKGSGINDYPTAHIVGYDHSDVLHAKRWKRGKRRFIPDIVCVHINSEKSSWGVNWNGRITLPFGQMSNGELVGWKIIIFIIRLFEWLRHHCCRPTPYCNII